MKEEGTFERVFLRPSPPDPFIEHGSMFYSEKSDEYLVWDTNKGWKIYAVVDPARDGDCIPIHGG